MARFEALQSDDGARLLEAVRVAAPTPATAIPVATRLRQDFPPELVATAMAMHDLRVRARAKFERADELWFTRDGLEQATSEPIARHRAGRYVGYAAIVDLCCGIGGDLLALASCNPDAALVAVDRDPLHLRMAEFNAAVVGVRDRIRFVEAEVRSVDTHDAALFIDPARRTGAGRARSGESEPPLDWCIAQADDGRPVGIKFAPGIDHERIPDGWELETIALGFDLKEAVLWSPALANGARTATVIDGDRVAAMRETPGDTPIPRTPEPGDILLDPNPAVTRAGLVADLARWLDAAMIDSQIAFLVTATPVDTPFARSLADRRVAAVARARGEAGAARPRARARSTSGGAASPGMSTRSRNACGARRPPVHGRDDAGNGPTVGDRLRGANRSIAAIILGKRYLSAEHERCIPVQDLRHDTVFFSP